MLVVCRRFPLHIWNVVLILFMQPRSSVEQGLAGVPSSIAKEGCAKPMGLYDGRILDSQLTASSSYSDRSLPKDARLGRPTKGRFGGWCPSQSIKRYPDRNGGPYYDQYLQIDFGHLVLVKGIRTQGRVGDKAQEIVKHYRVNYTRIGSHFFQHGIVSGKGDPKLLQGNDNPSTTNEQWFDSPLVVRTIRIIPQIYPPNQVCLRLELFGCNWTQGVVSYRAPQGNPIEIDGTVFSLEDNYYDGVLIDQTLTSGLGVLSDGTNGTGDLRSRRKRWIGWNKNVVTMPYVLFSFNEQRLFRSVTFICNLRDSSSISLFSTVTITTSITGTKFGSPVTHQTQKVLSGKFWKTYSVTVSICGLTGKYIRAQFAYRSDWILLSEVSFDSEVVGASAASNLGCVPVTFPPTADPVVLTTQPIVTLRETTTGSSNYSVTASRRKTGANVGLIVGIVCGTLAFILALTMLFYWWRYRNWRLHGEKPFNHFIKVELHPYNTGHGTHRISRLSSCAEERVGPDVEMCPVYASIKEEKAKMEVDTYEELPVAKTGANTRKITGSSMKKPPRNSVKKPTNPPPFPPVSVNGTTCSRKADDPEERYAEPSTPLLSENLESNEIYYAEPDSPSTKGPSLPNSSPGKQMTQDNFYAEPDSPKEKHLPIDLMLPFGKSKKSKKARNKKGFEPIEHAEPDKPVSLVSSPPISGYVEPIDAVNLNTNNDLIQNPIYEEIYSEPFQGVSGTSLYANPSDEIARADTISEFPRQNLKFKEKIGDGQFGEVHIGEAVELEEFLGLEPTCSTTTVAIKVLKTDVAKDIKEDFFKEVKIMARLKHENVVQLLGVCKDDPMLMIVEYMSNGDLNQFLSEHELGLGSEVHTDKVLTYQALLYMALQVASGMKYISSLNYVHRDLATRNLLVGHSYTVKIADFGMSRNTYCKHYYRVRGKAILPIRWMAPECILQGKFTTESDVWSYGVTLWEILTLAQYPYYEVSDEKVIENVHKIFYDVNANEPAIVLEKPDQCEDDVYEIMLSCWRRLPSDRVTFDELFVFLKDHVHLSEITI